MNWPAQPASADAFAGVQGKMVDSRVATFFASTSAASCRLVESTVLMGVGWRKGNALLLMSSASPGTSSAASDVVSASRSRTVLRYSREVSRRSGSSPAALGSGAVTVPALPPVPVTGPLPPAAPTPVAPDAAPPAVPAPLPPAPGPPAPAVDP